MQDIPKLCADFLRENVKQNLNQKLKASHAHELVAACFGYGSKNALLADKKFSPNRFPEASVIVRVPDIQIDKRRESLVGLPQGLPTSAELSEAIFGAIFMYGPFKGHHKRFDSFQSAGPLLIEKHNMFFDLKFPRSREAYDSNVELLEGETEVKVFVNAGVQLSSGGIQPTRRYTLTLPRIAGRIGFGHPQVSSVDLATLDFAAQADNLGGQDV